MKIINENIKTYSKFLKENGFSGFSYYLEIVKYLLFKLGSFIYLTFIVKIISLPINIYYILKSILNGDFLEVIPMITTIRHNLDYYPSVFFDYYARYASYEGYTPDDVVEIGEREHKVFLKDWQGWVTVTFLRDLKGDCDDYTTITSKFLDWAGVSNGRYLTAVVGVKDGQVYHSKTSYHAVAVAFSSQHSRLKSLEGKILTWGRIYTKEEYEKLYVKNYHVSGSKANYVIYVRYY